MLTIGIKDHTIQIVCNENIQCFHRKGNEINFKYTLLNSTKDDYSKLQKKNCKFHIQRWIQEGMRGRTHHLFFAIYIYIFYNHCEELQNCVTRS